MWQCSAISSFLCTHGWCCEQCIWVVCVSSILGQVSRWMTDVHREDESVQMFLVGTKSDLYNEVGNDEPSAFARSHRMEYIETSAKDGRNVKALFGIAVALDWLACFG